MRSFAYILAAFVSLMLMSCALRLEVMATKHGEPVCIRDFAQEEQLVVINIKTNGHDNDGQTMLVTVTDSMNNELRRLKSVTDKAKIAFTSHSNVVFDVCFTNTIEGNRNGYFSREVDVDIESGAAARDWNAIQAAEKLKPNEVQLRRIQEVTSEIIEELQYLKAREARMRDTNESSNARVQWFSTVVVFSLVALGVWQIAYLRSYFKAKHII